jgi:hypothetical protein
MRDFTPSESNKFLVGGIDCCVQSGRDRDDGVACGQTGKLGLCEIGLIDRVRKHSTEVIQTSFPFGLHFSSFSTGESNLSTIRLSNLEKIAPVVDKSSGLRKK